MAASSSRPSGVFRGGRASGWLAILTSSPADSSWPARGCGAGGARSRMTTRAQRAPPLLPRPPRRPRPPARPPAAAGEEGRPAHDGQRAAKGLDALARPGRGLGGGGRWRRRPRPRAAPPPARGGGSPGGWPRGGIRHAPPPPRPRAFSSVVTCCRSSSRSTMSRPIEASASPSSFRAVARPSSATLAAARASSAFASSTVRPSSCCRAAAAFSDRSSSTRAFSRSTSCAGVREAFLRGPRLRLRVHRRPLLLQQPRTGAGGSRTGASRRGHRGGPLPPSRGELLLQLGQPARVDRLRRPAASGTTGGRAACRRSTWRSASSRSLSASRRSSATLDSTRAAGPPSRRGQTGAAIRAIASARLGGLGGRRRRAA